MNMIATISPIDFLWVFLGGTAAGGILVSALVYKYLKRQPRK